MAGSTLLHSVLSHHQTRAVEQVDRYWHQKAALGVVPYRSDIDPGDIQDALEYAFIAECVSGGHARFRVAGGAVSAVLGMEVAGMALGAVIAPNHRGLFADNVAELFQNPQKLRINLRSSAPGQPNLQADMRLYPLLETAGRARMLLGSFVTKGTVGCAPRRFEIAEISSEAVAPERADHNTPILVRRHLSLVISNKKGRTKARP